MRLVLFPPFCLHKRQNRNTEKQSRKWNTHPERHRGCRCTAFLFCCQSFAMFPVTSSPALIFCTSCSLFSFPVDTRQHLPLQCYYPCKPAALCGGLISLSLILATELPVKTAAVPFLLSFFVNFLPASVAPHWLLQSCLWSLNPHSGCLCSCLKYK